MDYDIIVLGGGPGGYVAAIKAAQLGKKTAVIEKGSFGGVCLNKGCIPTKTLLRSAEALEEVKNMAEFGVTGPDASKAVLDMKQVQLRKNSIVQQIVAGIKGLLQGNGVTVIEGEGSVADKHTVVVGGKKITGEYLIIATGSEAQMMKVPTDPAMKILISDDILNLDYIPEEMVILGGGVVAIEFAYFLGSVGCKVSVIVRSRILRMATDAEISEEVAERLQDMGIAVYEAAQVKEISKDAVIFEKDGQRQEIKTKQVLVATGREPSLVGVPCEKLGIKLNKGAIVTDDTMKTSVDNIYAIGDVNGKAMLAHVASMEGIVAVENICGITAKMDYDQVPGCIYIQPEVASIGFTEEQAREKYGDVKVGKFYLSSNGKAKVANQSEGFIKVIVEPKYHGIVGVHIYALRATDMIAEAAVAMKMEGVAENITDSIHPHPTVSEIIPEAFHAAIGKAIHRL